MSTSMASSRRRVYVVRGSTGSSHLSTAAKLSDSPPSHGSWSLLSARSAMHPILFDGTLCGPAISRIVARRIHITHTPNRIPVIHTHALTPTRHSGTKETRGAEV